MSVAAPRIGVKCVSVVPRRINRRIPIRVTRLLTPLRRNPPSPFWYRTPSAVRPSLSIS